MIKNKDEFYATLKEALKECGGDSASNCIWNTLAPYFKPERFPCPIILHREEIEGKKINGKATIGTLIRHSWDCYEDVYYRNTKDGKIYTNYKDIYNSVSRNVITSEGREEQYYKYIPKYDAVICFEFSVQIDGYKLEAIDVFPNKAYGFDFMYASIYQDNEGIRKTLTSNYYRLAYSDIFKYSHESFLRAMYRMYGSTFVNINANHYERIDDNNNYLTFLRQNDKKKNTALQKKIDELTSFELPNINIKKVNASYKQYIKNILNKDTFSITSIDKVTDNTSVIRWSLYSRYTKEVTDVMRVYCVGNDLFACRRNSFGEYVAYDTKKLLSLSLVNFDSDLMLDIKKENVEGTRFKYYCDIVNAQSLANRSYALWAFIKNPILERMAKTDMSKLLSICLHDFDNDNNIIANIKDVFTANTEENDVFKFVGLNNHQINTLTNYISNAKIPYYKKRTEYLKNMIRRIKVIFSMNDISYVDDNTFDKLVDALANKSNLYEWELERLSKAFLECYDKNVYNSFVSNTLSNLIKLGIDLSSYSDYLYMLKKMDLLSKYPLSFDSIGCFEVVHYQISTIYKAEKNKELLDSFNENVKKIESYKYSPSNSEFVVVLPTSPEDLVYEGAMLHHCVKMYIESVAQGETNIVFIRRKDELEKPFFTVEVDNNKRINQVHGFGNCNADTVPNLEDFIEKWAKSKKIKLF